MDDIEYTKYIERAKNSFLTKEYQNAILNYSLALEMDQKSKEARLGIILCDLAIEKEQEANAVFEYYEAIKSKENNAEDLVEEIIETLEFNNNAINAALENLLWDKLEASDSLEYEDFIMFVEERGDFKKAFEDVLFSTKILIKDKEEFIDFLTRLLANGYQDMAYRYLEGALSVFPSDPRILKLCENMK